MTKNQSAVRILLARHLLALLGIQDKSLRAVSEIENELNKTIPYIAANRRSDRGFSNLINLALEGLAGHAIDILVTDDRCLNLAKLVAKKLNVKLIYTKGGEFFDGETNALTFLSNDALYGIFVTTITDGLHLLPLYKKFAENAKVSVVYTLLDYQFASTQAECENLDMTIHSVLTLPLILDVAYSEDQLTEEEIEAILEWQSSFTAVRNIMDQA